VTLSNKLWQHNKLIDLIDGFGPLVRSMDALPPQPLHRRHRTGSSCGRWLALRRCLPRVSLLSEEDGNEAASGYKASSQNTLRFDCSSHTLSVLHLALVTVTVRCRLTLERAFLASRILQSRLAMSLPRLTCMLSCRAGTDNVVRKDDR
jgi:hypothetical protein